MYIRRFDPADADAVVRVSELATRITSGADAGGKIGRAHV